MTTRPMDSAIIGIGNPDKAKLLGDTIQTNRSIQGRLIYANEEMPAGDVKVNIFAKGNEDLFLGSARTAMDGSFRFEWQSKAKEFYRQQLLIGIVEKKRPFAESHGLRNANEEVPLLKLGRTITKADSDLGDIEVDIRHIPPNITDVIKPPKSHEQPSTWRWALRRAGTVETIKSLIIKALKWVISAEWVQRIYNSFGTNYPRAPLTSDALLYELMNNVSAVAPKKVENGRVVWEANWNHLALDMEGSLPNVEVVANCQPDEDAELESIAVKFRDEAEASVYKPGDDGFERAVYLARSAFAVKGEAEVHLGQGHILPGIVGRAFFKYMSGSPLFAFAAHLEQIHWINFLGSQGIIFGKGSVLDASALAPDDIATVIVDSLSSRADYINYKPEEPLAKNHDAAHIQKLWYEMLYGYFEGYIDENWDEIKATWPYIYRFSTSIHKRYDKIPPITLSADAPAGGDKKRLVQFFTWVVNLTTWAHWNSHSRQVTLADLRSASLSIQNKALNEDGSFNVYGNTPVELGMNQLKITRTLLNYDGDTIMENPHGNIQENLRERCLAVMETIKAEFPNYRDIDNMFQTTHI